MSDLAVKAVLTADGKQLVGEVDQDIQALDKLQRAAKDVGATSKAAADGQAALGNTLRNTREKVNQAADAHKNLSMQGMAAMHSVRAMVEGFALGMPPTQIFAGQISHLSFAASGPGGLKGAFQEVTGTLTALLNPMALTTVSAVALTAAYGLLALKAIEAADADRRFAAVMAVSGSGLGLSAQQYRDLADAQAEATHTSQASSEQMLAAMSAAGMGSIDLFKSASQGARDWASATGMSSDAVQKALVQGMRDPVAALKGLQDQFHDTDQSVIDLAQDLDDAGNHTQAQFEFIKEWTRLADKAATAAKNWGGNIPAIAIGGGDAIVPMPDLGPKADNSISPLYQSFLQASRQKQDANKFADNLIASLDPVTTALRRLAQQEDSINKQVTAGTLDQVKANTAINLITQKRADLLDQLSAKSRQQAAEDERNAAAAERRAKQQDEEQQRLLNFIDAQSNKLGTELAAQWQKASDAAQRYREEQQKQADELRSQTASDVSSGLQGLSIYAPTEGQAARFQDAVNQLNTWRMKQRDAIYETMAGNKQMLADTETIYNDRLAQIYEEDLRRRTDWVSGVRRANLDITSSYADMASYTENFLKTWAQDGEDAFAKLASTGKLNVSNLVNFVLEQMARLAWQQNIAPSFNTLGSSLLDDIGNLFGKTPTLQAPGLDMFVDTSYAATTVPTLHGGGNVGTASGFRSIDMRAFFDAPRFHDGTMGLNVGERAAILKDNEHVYTAEQNQALTARPAVYYLPAPANDTAAAPVIHFNVTNTHPTARVRQGQSKRNSDGSFSIAIIVDQVSQTMAENSRNGTDPLTQSLEQTHGMVRRPA
jgi:phage-related minor tail protein